MTVAAARFGGDVVVVGRDSDVRAVLREHLRDEGRARLTLLDGPPGVGKSTLARTIVEGLALDANIVLQGAALPLVESAPPLLAFRDALRSLPGQTAPAPPALDAEPGSVLVAVDEWIDELTTHGRVVLFIDDLHWADQATLDLLLFLIACPRERPLSILGTMRDSVARASDRLAEWVDAVERTSRSRVMRVEPLSREVTMTLIEALIGEPVTQELTERIWVRSGGFPYHVCLLIDSRDPVTGVLPARLPDRLADAVLAKVATQPAAVVRLLRIMALVAMPVRPEHLARIVEVGGPAAGVGASEIGDLLAVAMRSGALVLGRDDRVWFHHPLTAELLERELDIRTAQVLHAACVEIGEEREQQLPLGFAESLRVADHAAASGDRGLALRWAMLAADRARQEAAHADELRLLQRARSLAADTDCGDADELAERCRRAAHDAGALEAELVVVEELLSSAPRRRLELLVRRTWLRAATQREDMFEAPVILEPDDGVSEWHPIALALASLKVESSMVAVEQAQSALRRALDRGSLAVAWAAAVLSDLELFAGSFDDARHHAEQAYAHAMEAGDPLCFNWAWHTAAFARVARDGESMALLLNEGRTRATQRGFAHTFRAWSAAAEAEEWLDSGALVACADALRSTIGADPGQIAELRLAATAGRLALRQGRRDDALAHLARRREAPPDRQSIATGFDLLEAECCIEDGDTLTALAAVERCAETLTDDPFLLLPVAARVLGDLREKSDPRVVDADAIVDELWAAAARPSSGFLPTAAVTAIRALVVAERTRGMRGEKASTAWRDAALAAAAAERTGDEAYALLREAEAHVLQRRPDRVRAAQALRRAREVAANDGAALIRSACDDLARMSRIRLDGAPPQADSGSPRQPAGQAAGLVAANLTPREREIVALVVGGRTYAEISHELFISEKTVSSHISNILRKTGAAGRIELAHMAQRGLV